LLRAAPSAPLTLEALNSKTGDSLAIVQVEAEGKDRVLTALSYLTCEAILSFSYHLVEIGEPAPRLSVESAVWKALRISVNVVLLDCSQASLKAAITSGMYELIRRKSIISS
jgi:hypothetical protein